MLIGGIEGGGTKFVCAIGDAQGRILARERIPTTTPEETLRRSVAYFADQQAARDEKLAAFGIASFGPVDLNPASAHYGFITRTPKAGWSYADVAGAVRRAFPGAPVGFDTDVNGAGLAEHRWGAARAWRTFVYLTIGTGIGGGGMHEGHALRGLIHPEMGHLQLPIRADDPLQRGVCPFHAYCFEGLASGPSIEGRWGQRGETLPPDHPAWDLEAHYIAHALMDIMTVLSPEGFVLGGSVMHQRQLFPLIRAKLAALANGYFVHPRLETFEDYVVPPALGDDAGVCGAFALALGAFEEVHRG
ncbi:MAG: ROK family protein [Anaerolineae bacterium]|nr:ROK family protein [Anaerolineae bacterium]